MNSVIEASTDKVPFTGQRGDEQTFLLSYPAHHAKYIRMLAQEDEAIEAEAVLAQAEEALVLG